MAQIDSYLCKFKLEDICNTWNVAYHLQIENATKRCQSVFLRYFEHVIEKDDLGALNKELFSSAISSDDLYVVNELFVIQAILLWIKDKGLNVYNRNPSNYIENKDTLFSELISHVRFGNITAKMIEQEKNQEILNLVKDKTIGTVKHPRIREKNYMSMVSRLNLNFQYTLTE